MSDKIKNKVIVVLVCIIAILLCILAFVAGMKFADIEDEIINPDNTENSNISQIINCNGDFPHQYGNGTENKKYIFNNDKLEKFESVIKYDFGTEELAKNMNNKMNNCGLYSDDIDCKSIQDGQYVIVTINITEANFNNISEYSNYKNITVDDVLNKNIESSDIFNNQNMTCTK